MHYKKEVEQELKQLRDLGLDLEVDIFITAADAETKNKPTVPENLRKERKKGLFPEEYQNWYTQSFEVIRQLIPFRLQEFEILYKGQGFRKQITVSNFNIQDYLCGKSLPDVNSHTCAFNHLNAQRKILDSTSEKFHKRIFEIEDLVKAELFDSELHSAEELQKKGFLRAAGAIAGVVLEKHLSDVCTKSPLIKISKKTPHISDFNDLLKENGIIEIPTWRHIQLLNDLRNLCDHDKKKEPTKEDISQLIDGVKKIIKTVF